VSLLIMLSREQKTIRSFRWRGRFQIIFRYPINCLLLCLINKRFYCLRHTRLFMNECHRNSKLQRSYIYIYILCKFTSAVLEFISGKGLNKLNRRLRGKTSHRHTSYYVISISNFTRFRSQTQPGFFIYL